MEARLARIAGTTDLAMVADADIVIEAVFEDFGVKQQVFAALDRVAKPGAVLATNTSYLDVDALARGTIVLEAKTDEPDLPNRLEHAYFGQNVSAPLAE